jgi:hypothetical protein
VQEVSLTNPEALIVARDLYVAEYDIDVNAMVYSVAADALGLQEMVDQAYEEMLTQVFIQMEEDALGGHMTVGGGRMSDDLFNLLNELRQVEEIGGGQGGVMADIRIDVEIDGKHIYTWSDSDFDWMIQRPRKAVKPVELKREQQEKLQALRKDGRRWLKYAGEQLSVALDRSAPIRKKRKPRKSEKQSPAKSTPVRLRDVLQSFWKWLTGAIDEKQEVLWSNAEDRDYFEQRLGQLLEMVEKEYCVILNNALTPPPESGPFSLTPGKHQVKVIPTIIASATGGGIIGATTGATLQTSVIVKFRARNPHDWPRLRGEIEISGSPSGGQYMEEDVEFPQSALDIVCDSEGQLHLLPYTGDPAQPYGEPRPFPVDMGFTSKYLAAGAADEFGRTWLAASDGESVVIARNQGVGGFVKLVPPSLPTSAEEITGLTIGPEAFLVFLRQRLAVYLNLHKVERVPTEEIDLKILNRLLLSGVARDVPIATQVYLNRNTLRLLVANRFSSQLTTTVLNLRGGELSPSFIEGYEEPRPRRDICSVAWDDTNLEPLGVVAFRKERRIEWFTIRSAQPAQINPFALSRAVLNLASPPAAIYVGPGKGLTILLEPAGQLLYRETATDSLHVLDFEGGITAMCGRGTVLAASRKESNLVRIFECLQTG